MRFFEYAHLYPVTVLVWQGLMERLHPHSGTPGLSAQRSSRFPSLEHCLRNWLSLRAQT